MNSQANFGVDDNVWTKVSILIWRYTSIIETWRRIYWEAYYIILCFISFPFSTNMQLWKRNWSCLICHKYDLTSLRSFYVGMTSFKHILSSFGLICNISKAFTLLHPYQTNMLFKYSLEWVISFPKSYSTRPILKNQKVKLLSLRKNKFWKYFYYFPKRNCTQCV